MITRGLLNSERDIEVVINMLNQDNYERRKRYLEHVFDSFIVRTKHKNKKILENLDIKKLQSQRELKNILDDNNIINKIHS